MSCIKHFLGFRWERHTWDREVTHTEDWSARATDMWSRAVPVDEVICHIKYVCRACGAVRDGGECVCEEARGAVCPARLAYLAELRSKEHGAQAPVTG